MYKEQKSASFRTI